MEKYTDEWGNKFPDGESYDLEYPEVTLAPDAVYAKNEGIISSLGNYKVLLESTIGFTVPACWMPSQMKT